MIKVRLIEFEDIATLAEMGKYMHAEGVFNKSDYDVKKVTTMLTDYYADGDKLSLVAVNEDGIVGWFLASLSAHYFGATKLAVEQCMYIHPLHRGSSAATRFMKKFEHWARYMEAEAMLFMPCNNGVDDRWDKFAKRFGYTQTGYIFTRNV
tara:strand:- start:27026 stop:27478 length:453 start_codon:yes stop_codon:yes gene_type:complete